MTDATRIGLQWLAGSSNGGSDVIDYRVWYALETEDYQVLEESVLVNSYTTTSTLQAGNNYKFKVQSRNSVGYSADSIEAIITAASVPDVPTNMVT